MTTAYVVVDSPVDELTLVTDGLALTGLYLAVHRHADRTRWGRRTEPEQAPAVLRLAARQLQDYFAGERTTFDLPLGAVGTEFQHRVWRALAEIPYARTWSYADLAARVGSPGASRAVGL
ncbi:MAG: MGMT family protein, partial [Actinomycetota bacterium]|nr:MGMT family protein [Actinomycetota bacterium]